MSTIKVRNLNKKPNWLQKLIKTDYYRRYVINQLSPIKLGDIVVEKTTQSEYLVIDIELAAFKNQDIRYSKLHLFSKKKFISVSLYVSAVVSDYSVKQSAIKLQFDKDLDTIIKE